MVGCLLAIGGAGEGQAGGLEVQLESFGRYIWDGDGEEDIVFFRIGRGGSLRPKD